MQHAGHQDAHEKADQGGCDCSDREALVDKRWNFPEAFLVERHANDAGNPATCIHGQGVIKHARAQGFTEARGPAHTRFEGLADFLPRAVILHGPRVALGIGDDTPVRQDNRETHVESLDGTPAKGL